VLHRHAGALIALAVALAAAQRKISKRWSPSTFAVKMFGVLVPEFTPSS
jgi:hypothetical protein